MTGRALVTVMLVAAACGDDGGLVLVDDAAPSFCPSGCNPLAAPGQQGCGAGERCGGIILTPGACAGVVAVHCVPVGTVGLNETCVWGQAGLDTGHDDCAPGLVCASDARCRDICGFGAGPGEACAAPLVCVAQAGLFEPGGGGDPVYGVCAPML